MQYQNRHHRRSEACFHSYTSRKRPKKISARSCSAASFKKWNKWNIRLYSPINTRNITFHFLIQKVERATKKLKAKEGPYTAGEGTSDTL